MICSGVGQRVRRLADRAVVPRTLARDRDDLGAVRHVGRNLVGPVGDQRHHAQRLGGDAIAHRCPAADRYRAHFNSFSLPGSCRLIVHHGAVGFAQPIDVFVHVLSTFRSPASKNWMKEAASPAGTLAEKVRP